MSSAPARALLTLLVLAFAPWGPASPASQQGGRKSLEELLAELRHRRDVYLAGLKASVDQLIAELEKEVEANHPAEIERVRKEIVKLGTEAAPLLVPSLEPGAAASRVVARRSLEVAVALQAMPTAAVTEGLLALLRDGTATARRNALIALTTTPEPERVCPVIRKLYQDSEGAMREAALQALATIGCEGTREVLRAALGDEDMDVVRTALRALTASKICESVGDVLNLLRNEKAVAVKQLDLILRYLESCPDAVTSDHLQALLSIANEGRVAERTRVEVLHAIPNFANVVTRDIKKQLQNVAQSPRREVQIEALVALTRLGDSRAQRELLKPYDDAVQRNKDWPDAWYDRADISFRIGEYNDAIRDARKALELRKADPRREDPEIYILLARAYCRAKRLKNARDVLKTAPGISLVKLRALGEEEDFEELKSRYDDVFPK